MTRKIKRPKIKRPKHRPRKVVPGTVPTPPDTPGLKHLIKAKPYFRPKPKRPKSDELADYLAANPSIASEIKWFSQASPNWQPYPTWSSAQKAQLATVYWQIRKGKFPGLSATPPMTYLSSGMWEGVTAGVGIGVDETTAWNYFLAHVAQSLVVEIAGLAPWSLKSTPSDQRSLLLTTYGLFEYHSSVNAHLLKIGATPGDPVRVYQFLATNKFIGLNRRETIGRLLDWCRANMRHYVGGLDAAVAQAHWQYNGYPPVERVIAGTTHPQYGFAHWTMGCPGTTSFLKAVLRTVNVAVERVSADGHATPHFVGENLYLSHGDDPYDGLLTTTPAIPIDALFIDQTKFTAWFGSNVAPLTQQDNVGRRCTELALQYLTDWILKLRCNDLAQGVTNEAASSVYNDSSLKLFKFYSLPDLQAMNLWSKLDAKIAAKGGCSSIVPGAITAAITAPAGGSTVFGSVVVNMAINGSTTAMNTFKLELQGNPLYNQTVAGTTASYTWNTLDWSNGLNTLKLTVTDAAGKTASATVAVTVANIITAAITAPVAGSTVSGSVTVSMTVSGHTITMNIFTLKIDGTQVFSQPTAGLTASYTWNTTTVGNGAHTLMLTVDDYSSKTATTSISVDVAN